MTKLDVAARCWLTGFVTGAVAGASVGTMSLPLFGTVFGGIIGAFVGFLVGLIESAVLVPLVSGGASRPVLGVAGGGTALVVMAPLAGGYAGLDGWVLAAVLLGTGTLAAALTPRTVAPATTSSPGSEFAARTLTAATAVGTGTGVLVGAVVGLYTNRSTALFAAVEVGVAGLVLGALAGAAIIAIRVAVRRHRGRREAFVFPMRSAR